MALIATPGAANANSFVTLTRANELLALRLFTGTWTAALDPDKEAALAWATTLLGTLPWLGHATYADQALAFPMTGLKRPNGQAVDSTTIPIEIERATAELAMRLLSSDPTVVSGIAQKGITEIQAGPMKVKFTEGFEAKVIPSAIMSLIPLTWYLNDVTNQVTSLIESV
jgi:hypothetical protein